MVPPSGWLAALGLLLLAGPALGRQQASSKSRSLKHPTEAQTGSARLADAFRAEGRDAKKTQAVQATVGLDRAAKWSGECCRASGASF